MASIKLPVLKVIGAYQGKLVTVHNKTFHVPYIAGDRPWLGFIIFVSNS